MYSFGWKPSLPDIRDYKFQAKQMGPLPDAVDLRSEFPGVWDQGRVSSCTSHAGVALARQVLKKSGVNEHLSRLFVYYNTREIEGSVKFDGGATLRSTMKAMAGTGICSEDQWSYMPEKVKNKPPVRAYKEATKRMVRNYYALPQTEESLKQCLAEGYGFVFGFAVYDSFLSDEVKRTGFVQMPKPGERVHGGHAISCVGFRENYFIIRNSWGDKFGDKGHCYFPYEFILNPCICLDFWTLRTVSPLS